MSSFKGSTPVIAMATIITIFIVSFPLSAPVRADAGPLTDTEALGQIALRLAERLEDQRGALYYDLLQRSSPAQAALNADADIALMYVSDRGIPKFYLTENVDAAGTVSTNRVWPGGSGGFNLTGSGTALGELAVWDGGAVRVSHQEYGGRVTQIDGASTTHYHATHVAGTLVAAGVDPDAKGMSFQANLAAYDWNSDETEMAAAAASGLNVSNHSYGYGTGWSYNSTAGDWYWYGDVSVDSTEDYGFGFYEEVTRAYDEIAYNAPYYNIVASAGNERDDDGPGAGGGHYFWNPDTDDWEWSTMTRNPDGGAAGYGCVSWNKNAKNILAIGAVEDIPSGWTDPSDVVATYFTSWGPTDDGRIKPDLVANGWSLYSTDDDHDSDYRTLGGTSMSSPNAAGSINLLVRYYETSHGNATPLASTMKAILIQSADEAGPDPGPDYMFGWGLINTLKSAQLIQADSLENGRILADSLLNGETHEYYFESDGVTPIRVSLAWTDPPGTPPAPSLNPPDLMLVNDLDIRLEEIGASMYMPYILDPANPANAATTGDNIRDNAEQIFVASPPAGTYKISLTHEGTLASPQVYSLACSHNLGTDPPVPPDPPEWVDMTAAGDLGSTAAGIGAAWGDYDGDGDLDLYLTNTGGANNLFRNDGAGFFADVTPALLADANDGAGVAWADYDNDADLDLYLVNDGSANVLFKNSGAGSFAAAGGGALLDAGNGRNAPWADYDHDRKSDLYLVNEGQTDKLIRGLGGDSFADVTGAPLGDSGNGGAAAWGDYNGDGEIDLYVAHQTAGQSGLFRNEGLSGFVEVTGGPLSGGPNNQCGLWGDYDNDGDLDLFVANSDTLGSKLLRNDGAGTFASLTGGPTSISGAYGAAWGDYDNDGDLDLYLASSGINRFYRNDGNDTFAAVYDSLLANSGDSRCAVAGDYDNDGDLDLYVVNNNAANKLYRNDIDTENHWMHIDLTGDASNRSAIGARIRLVAGGITHTREISGGAGFGQNSLTAEFGLGAVTLVDTIEIHWPSSYVQTMETFAADQFMSITEDALSTDITGSTPELSSFRFPPNVPNPFNPVTKIRFELPRPGDVTLAIYDVSGRRVAVLADGHHSAGSFEKRWDGRDADGRIVPSGVYFAKLEVADFQATRKLLLVK